MQASPLARSLCAVALGWLAFDAAAQTTSAGPSAAAAPPPACSGAEYRQFDFWVGDWIVHGGPDGDQLQGTNRIERSGNGCWLIERWRSAKGNDGTSLNAWDAPYRVWRQFWTGADGVVLRLQGGRQGDAMVMTGELPAAGGRVQRQRISWTPAADGSVVQRWETSDDDGAHWTVSFPGVYRRTGSP